MSEGTKKRYRNATKLLSEAFSVETMENSQNVLSNSSTTVNRRGGGGGVDQPASSKPVLII